MRKWWMGAALAAMLLGQGAAIEAQSPPAPSSPYAPSSPEPLPDPLPVGISGPMNPMIAPAGPPCLLSLNPTIPGAFQDEVPAEQRGVYFHVGASGLRRNRLGHGPIALLDTFNKGLDTGGVPRFDSPVAADFSDVSPDYGWGPRATLGFLSGDHAIELTGFYLPQKDATVDHINPGMLSAPFINPPLGFEGDNGLWLQADHIQTTLRTTMGNAEVNYRQWNKAVTGVEAIVGVRYMYLQERLGIFTDDDGITITDALGRPDPVRQATYTVKTQNQIIAPQLGFEYNLPILSWVTFGCNAKGAWGANFVQIDKSLVRGDGFSGFSLKHNDVIFSQLYEIAAYLDLSLTEQMRVRAGYTAMWVLQVPEATSQVQFDLANQFPKNNYNGSIFYHGPTIEVQFFF